MGQFGQKTIGHWCSNGVAWTDPPIIAGAGRGICAKRLTLVLGGAGEKKR